MNCPIKAGNYGRGYITDRRSATVSPAIRNHPLSVVLGAATETEQANVALEELCRLYWFPVYAYIRRRGNSTEDAADLKPARFFPSLDRPPLVGRNPPRRGDSSGRFCSRPWRTSSPTTITAGTRRSVEADNCSTLDSDDPEGRYALDAPDSDTPETVFQKRWAFALLHEATDRLSRECSRAGEWDLFEALRGHLLEHGAGEPYAILAGRLA